MKEQGHLTSQERGQHCSLGSLSTAESRQVLSVKQRPAAELMLHQGNPAEAVERLPSAQLPTSQSRLLDHRGCHPCLLLEPEDGGCVTPPVGALPAWQSLCQRQAGPQKTHPLWDVAVREGNVFGRHDTGTSQGEAQKGQKAKRQETHPPADPALTTHSTWPFLQSCVSCLGKSHYVTVRLMTPRVEPVPGAVT